MRKKLKLIVTFVVFLLTSCTSTPPILSSNQKLVETQLSLKGEVVPVGIARELTIAESGKVLYWKDASIQLQEKYISALGLVCRVILINASATVDQSLEKRIACQTQVNDNWVLVPSIVKQAQFTFSLAE